jgi:hypothetical protein
MMCLRGLAVRHDSCPGHRHGQFPQVPGGSAGASVGHDCRGSVPCYAVSQEGETFAFSRQDRFAERVFRGVPGNREEGDSLQRLAQCL